MIKPTNHTVPDDGVVQALQVLATYCREHKKTGMVDRQITGTGCSLFWLCCRCNLIPSEFLIVHDQANNWDEKLKTVKT